jgi:hypothetical protein
MWGKALSFLMLKTLKEAKGCKNFVCLKAYERTYRATLLSTWLFTASFVIFKSGEFQLGRLSKQFVLNRRQNSFG